MLPQMIGYAKCIDSNKTMSFKVSDKKLNLVGKKLDGDRIHEYINT